MDTLSILLAATITFVVTNIDDIFVLMMFFSQTNNSFQRRHVVIGQYLGFIGIIAISFLGFLGSFIIPKEWIGLLGLAPIAIGSHKLIHLYNDKEALGQLSTKSTSPSVFSGLLHPKTYSVAIVTFANGGDNIGIYAPLFASSDILSLLFIIVVFLILVAVWCFIGYKLTHQPSIAQILSRYGHIVVPFVLIGLGIYIILENETLSLFGL